MIEISMSEEVKHTWYISFMGTKKSSTQGELLVLSIDLWIL